MQCNREWPAFSSRLEPRGPVLPPTAATSTLRRSAAVAAGVTRTRRTLRLAAVAVHTRSRTSHTRRQHRSAESRSARAVRPTTPGLTRTGTAASSLRRPARRVAVGSQGQAGLRLHRPARRNTRAETAAVSAQTRVPVPVVVVQRVRMATARTAASAVQAVRLAVLVVAETAAVRRRQAVRRQPELPVPEEQRATALLAGQASPSRRTATTVQTVLEVRAAAVHRLAIREPQGTAGTAVQAMSGRRMVQAAVVVVVVVDKQGQSATAVTAVFMVAAAAAAVGRATC